MMNFLTLQARAISNLIRPGDQVITVTKDLEGVALSMHLTLRTYAMATGSWSGCRLSSPRDESDDRRCARRFVDSPHDEHRRERPDGPRVLSRLLFDLGQPVFRPNFLLCRILDHYAIAESNGELPAHRPDDGLAL